MSEKDESRDEHNGGKFPNRDRGVAISEFIDSAGVNNRDTSVGSQPQQGEPTDESAEQEKR